MRHSTSRQINLFVLRHRLLILLITLLLLLIGFPFVHYIHSDYFALMEFFFSMILIVGIYIVSTNRQILTVAIILAMLTFTVIAFNLLIRSRGVMIFGLTLEIAYFILTTTVIISHVLNYKRVTADKIYGAICGYLLIGIIWAMIYTLLENSFPGSFYFAHGLTSYQPGLLNYPHYFSHFLYLSFVTLSTLGYGDITPISSAGRILCSFEAVVGQLYVAVLIARLVGLHISHSLTKT